MNQEKLISVIKKLIHQEVKKIIKPILKEVLKNEVNEILAEKFIHSTKNTYVKSVVENEKPVLAKKTDQRNTQQLTEMRTKFSQHLGIDEDSPLAGIYDDIDQRELSAAMSSNNAGGANSVILKGGVIYNPEGDDEGIPLELLGIK